jgi:hypothetical protein
MSLFQTFVFGVAGVKELKMMCLKVFISWL